MTQRIKTAVVKSRVEPNTWLAISTNDFHYFDTWTDAMHWALIIERIEAGNEFRRRIRHIKNLIALEPTE